jgi:capsid protein
LPEEQQLRRAVLRAKTARALVAAQMAEAASMTIGVERTRRERLMFAGSFPAVTRTRLTGDGPGGVSAQGGPAWGHVDTDSRAALRRDAQALTRSNCMAAAIVQCMKHSVVGPGPVLRAQTADRGWNAEAEELWYDYACGNGSRSGRTFDHIGLGSLPSRLREMVGDCLTDGASLDVVLADLSVQAVETERLVNRGAADRNVPEGDSRRPSWYASVPGMGAAGGPDWMIPGVGGSVGGVEIGPGGRVTGFSVGQYASGAGGTPVGGMVSAESPDVVGVDDALFMPCPIGARTNLIVPEPGLAVAIPRFEQIEALADSVRVAFYVATCFSAIITSKTPGLDQSQSPSALNPRGVGDEFGTNNPFDHEVEAVPGMIRWASQGDSVHQVKPEHPSQQYQDYVMLELGQVGAHIGCPVLLALGDPRQTNYSGFRAMLALAQQNFKVWRAELERRVLDKLYRRFIGRMIVEGRLAFREDFDRFNWTWPPMPVLDPVAEVQAQAMAVAAKLRTRDAAMVQLDGTNFEDELPRLEAEERAVEAARLKPGFAGIATPATDTAAPV